MPLGQQEGPAPNLHLWKKHDSGLPKNKWIRTTRLLPLLPPKSPREPGADFPFVSSLSPSGAVLPHCWKGEPGLLPAALSLLSMGTPSSPGQQQPLKLWVSHRSWELTPVVLFHVKHRNFLEMLQKFSLSV